MHRWSQLALSAIAAAAMTGCPEKKETPPASTTPATTPPVTPPATAAEKPAATATEKAAAGEKPGAAASSTGGGPAAAGATGGPPGTITGSVKFAGKAPEMKDIPKPTDPICAAAKPKDNSVLVAKDGAFRDVLVRISPGAVKGDAPAGSTPKLEQKGCMYTPRILGVVAGQDIEVVNGDKTMHNVHTYKGQETVLNVGQPAGSPPIKKPATDEPGVIKVKCDVHPWMSAFIVASDNPYFAVTGDDGKFKLDKVPAGKYTLEAWHSEFGLKTAEVTVSADKPAEIKFEYTGNEKKPE